jgi:hypothetical protein
MEVLNYKDDPRAVLIHFNPNHDPRNGQFSSKKGSGRTVVKDRWFDSTTTENPSPNTTSNDTATSSKPGKIYSKYQNADGVNVAAKEITAEQRQKLADYYGYVIKSYMSKISNDKQAGICKGNLADTSEPVGLWSVDSKSKDWVRTATYKAFCDALSGK